MTRLAALAVVLLMGVAPALAFDPASQAAIETLKRGKAVPITKVTDLMLGAEIWCYNQNGTECGWTDIYLSVEGNRVSFEITNPWDDTRDISFVSEGVLREGRFICETGYNWIPGVRAYSSADGVEIYGRELAAFRIEIEHWTDTAAATDCFDYVFDGVDSEAQTISLIQRQYVDGETDPANDAAVTLHYDKATAEGLGWYW